MSRPLRRRQGLPAPKRTRARAPARQRAHATPPRQQQAAPDLARDVADHALLPVPTAELVAQLWPACVAHLHLDHMLLLLIGCRAGQHSRHYEHQSAKNDWVVAQTKDAGRATAQVSTCWRSQQKHIINGYSTNEISL
jgi:hypothetical protein